MHFPYAPDDIDAVVFDMGGVFVIREGDYVRRGMAEAGITITADVTGFHRAHHVAVAAIAGLLTDEEVGTLHEHDPDFWVHFERAYLGALDVLDDDMDTAVRAMKTHVFDRFPKPIWCHLLQDNIDAFQVLARSGMPVAIVSNNDGTAEAQLAQFGICQVGPGPQAQVAAIVDSAVVGIAKPDPRIFEPALAALGTAPGRTLYVGDTVHADVHGARAAGMPVVQLDPYELHTAFDHARVPDVATLVGLLTR